MKTVKTITIPGYGKKQSGKVRDFYIKNDKRILITTDRISAFDRVLGLIPYKGQVLNELAAFWFKNTEDIMANHVLAVPDPNVTIAKNAVPIPIEMVVRGYITGVTGTSIWGSYQKGERTIYGIPFPEGLQKNQKLPTPVITPTTKAEVGHDERLTKDEILKRKIVSKDMYEQMEKAAFMLFQRGTEICNQAGIILVDTKYEFGIYQGKLLLIDEIHTPDSSRFWIKKTYKTRFIKGHEPENFDKEFMRLWYKEKGYTGDGIPPRMPQSFVKQISDRYIDIFEKITSQPFVKPRGDIKKRIQKNLSLYFQQPKSLAVLISDAGTGTNLQAIIDGIKTKKINARIAVVVSDTKDALGLTKAKKAHLPIALCAQKNDLLSLLEKYHPDYIVLAGWKQIITKSVRDRYPEHIINLHPGLIPDTLTGNIKNPDGTLALWNKGMLTEKAIAHILTQKVSFAGSSLHFLSDEVDFGRVLDRCFEKVKPHDNVKTLYQRLKKKENKMYQSVLAKLCKA